MDAHRVSESEAEAGLRALIDRVVSGEPVVITRDGQPVAELRAAPVTQRPAPDAGPKHRTPEAEEAWRRLKELRDSLPPSDISSVDLIDEIREERELSVAGLHRR
jgi:antitoxin (DNA-binding transcriptional repressor) of toxin-antitoxin stability system